MLIFETGTYNPFFNLATEEFLFRNYKQEIFLVYINNRSVITGKHQNPYEEVNLGYIRKNEIPVIRRISGGGTVYHDKGNLNFTFIKNLDPGKPVNYKKFSDPVMDFLRIEGLNPVTGEKNEVREEGKKFSGNAEHVFRNRALHHGTILFSTSLDELHNSLRTEPGSYISKAITSNRTTVGNLSEKLRFNSAGEMMVALVEYMSKREENEGYGKLNQKERIAINKLVSEKYSTWDWNWGYGPKYRFTRMIRFSGKPARVNIDVAKGRITGFSIDAKVVPAGFNELFIGLRHKPEDIKEVFSKVRIPITEDELYSFF